MRTSRSSSVSSSTSATSETMESHQIFVKLPSNETIPLTLPTTTPLTHLLHLLSLRLSTPPSTLRLTHAGHHLTPSTSLATMPQNATLALSFPIRGGAPKKTRCTFKDCKEAAQKIVGDCSFCQGKFCGKHRMLEDHKCTGLEDCKKESHERNADRLNAERTIAVKGI